MKTLFISSVCTLLFSLQAYSQESIKFGKIDIKDLEMTTYEPDSSAEAVVLWDEGTSQLSYDQRKGFYLVFERHTRIKILTKQGYDWANVEVPLYHSGQDKEKVSGLKGATYFLENGKMKTVKLGKEAIFDEKVSENWDNKKFTLANVTEGAIIEYQYRIDSDFIFNFQDWSFQRNIPTVTSQYTAKIPEYFRYEKFMQGFHPLSDIKEDRETENIILSYKENADQGYVKKTNYSTESLSFTKNVTTWLAKDVPAFREEPYMSNLNDYISRINFELASTRYPNQPVKQYMGTWESINKTMLESEAYSTDLNTSGFLKEDVSALTAEAKTDEERIQNIYHYVKSKVKWDNRNRMYPTSSFRKVLDDGEGSSADINLLLVNMLRKAGFESDPVLISTRGHGMIREYFPLSSQFNYVMAVADIDGNYLLLDATDRSLPINLLPTRCLNGQGWRVSKDRAGWVGLNTKGNEGYSAFVEMKIGENGSLGGKIDINYLDYSASNMRNRKLREEDNFKKYIEESRGWAVSTMELKGDDNIYQPFRMICEADANNQIENLGDLIYIDPFIVGKVDENPFKLEERQFPVDFGTGQSYNYVFTLEVPEGYKVESLPQNISMSLPNNDGKYTMISALAEGKIMVRSSFKVTKPLFSGPEYLYLKQFYAQMVDKQAEQIVLKRID